MREFECSHTQDEARGITAIPESSPSEERLCELSEFFKAFSDPTRLKIILALSQRELCVCQIARVAGMSQSAISHQLKYLKNINIVKSRREGKSIIYSISDMHISHIYGEGLIHICEEVKNNG